MRQIVLKMLRDRKALACCLLALVSTVMLCDLAEATGLASGAAGLEAELRTWSKRAAAIGIIVAVAGMIGSDEGPNKKLIYLGLALGLLGSVGWMVSIFAVGS